MNEKIRERIITDAKGWIGEVENPKDSNHIAFNEWFGHGMDAVFNEDGSLKKKGQPYCGGFCSYIHNFAERPLPKIDYDEGFVSVPNFLKWAIKNKKVTNDPKPGDMFVIDFQGKADNSDINKVNVYAFDHVGFFENWVNDSEKKFNTIEGNTSPDHRGSQSNGGGVWARIRENSKSVIFINVID